jgi:RNA polymerase sigma-70 factor, ECF subfamily
LDSGDQHILTALRADRQDSFEEMFRTSYNPLCNYAYSFLRSRDEAEEAVQSVFIQFWEKRKDIQIETSLDSYLYRAVRNTCMNVLKHEKVKSQYASFAMQGNGDATGVEAGIETVELEDRIAAAMMKLPEQCRLVFRLSRFEELKYAEIAEKLGISVKTVENQMGKALKIMREQLKDYLPLLALWLTIMEK